MPEHKLLTAHTRTHTRTTSSTLIIINTRDTVNRNITCSALTTRMSPDDRVGGKGILEVEVCHGQGAPYQYDVLVPNVVVTAAAAAGMEVRIGLNREGQAVKVYTMGHWEGQPEVQWTAEPRWRELLHSKGEVGRGRADGQNSAELDRAEKEKERRQKEAAAEGLDMLGNGRDRKDMLQKWAQRLRGEGNSMAECLDRKWSGAALAGRTHQGM